MANKQINELSELTTASGTDLLVAYDGNESGSEKTKKVQVSNMIGGWILVEEYVLNNETIDETISWDADRMKTDWWGKASNNSAAYIGVRFNGDSGNNYAAGLISQNGGVVSAVQETRDDLYVSHASNVDLFMSVEFTTGTPPTGSIHFAHGMWSRLVTTDTDNQLGTIAIRWNNSNAITSIRFYNGAATTGTLKVYKWNDVRVN